MTDGATGLVKQLRSSLRLLRFRQRRVARGRLRCSHEAREVVDIRKSIRTGRVVWLRRRVAEFGHLVRKEPAGNAHLVQVSIARKREQAGMLILPAESPDTRLPRGFDDRHMDYQPANLAV